QLRGSFVDADDPCVESVHTNVGRVVREYDCHQRPVPPRGHEGSVRSDINTSGSPNPLHDVLERNVFDSLSLELADELAEIDLIEIKVPVRFDTAVHGWVSFRQRLAIAIQKCAVLPAV